MRSLSQAPVSRYHSQGPEGSAKDTLWTAEDSCGMPPDP